MITIKDGGYAQMTPAEHQGFSLRRLRVDFLAQPPARQAETRARVERLLADERRRGQRQPSYLALHAREIYGL